MSETPSEGVIKFKYNLKMSKPFEEELFINLEKWRAILFKMNLIGEYPIEKVGFGNLSKRLNKIDDSFIITGTQTGKYPHLNGSQYTKILKCNLQKMSLDALGPVAPSSESLTHYSIYSTCPQVNAVFHIHNEELWNFMLKNNFPQTSKEIDYGTQEMAIEAKKCIGATTSGIFAMAGHQDGIISYGASVEEAGKIILETLKVSKK